MSKPQALNITVNAAELESFCQQLLKRSRDIGKAHDALITLEAFISVFATASQGSNEYQLIKSSMQSVTDKSRQQLLEKNTSDLTNALKQCNVVALASVHTPLSRNGFYQILQSAIKALSDDDIRLIMAWSANWLVEAKRLAREASGFPDAMDFAKAGINIEEYHAMMDIDRVLNFSS